jgi:hypothetical protein
MTVSYVVGAILDIPLAFPALIQTGPTDNSKIVLALFGLNMVAGLLGGVINAYLSDNGFLLPKVDTASSGQRIWRPGVMGNLIVGFGASVVFWLLNTDFGAIQQIVSNENMRAIGGALLAGVAGARVLTNEIDKRLLQAAAADAAASKGSPGDSGRIQNASPAAALQIAKSLPK